MAKKSRKKTRRPAGTSGSVPVRGASAGRDRGSGSDRVPAGDRASRGDRGSGPERERAEAAVVVAATDSGEDDALPPVRWGLLDVFGWLALAIVLSTAWTLVVAAVGGYSLETLEIGEAAGRVVGQLATGAEPELPKTLSSAPLTVYVLGQVPLWAVFIGGAVFSTRRRGNGFVRDLRWRFQRVDVPVGLAIGVAFQLVAVPLLYRVVFLFIGEQDVSAEARELTDRATGPLSFLVLVVIVGIGAPIAEEIFYRGLALGAMERRWGTTWGLVASSGLFALTHNQPLQFPALLAFGLVLGWMVQRTGRLGPAVWAHLGFNMTAALALVLELDLPS